MTRALHARLARLEGSRDTQSGLVVLEYSDGDDVGKERLISALIDRADARATDTFVSAVMRS